MKKGRLIKRLSALLSAAVLCCGLSADALAESEDGVYLPGYEYIGEQVGTAFLEGEGADEELSAQEAGGTAVISVDESRYYYYGNWMTRWFYVTTSAGVHNGQCAIAENHTPRGNFAIHEYNDWRIKTLLACQPQGPLWESYHTTIWGPNDADSAYCLAHIAIAYVYTGRLSFVGSELQAGIRNVVDNALPIVYQQQKELIDDYYAYICFCSGVNSSYQDIVWMEYEPQAKNGKVLLLKRSAIPQITEGNSCYSLYGAQYGVYTDIECTNEVASLTTDAAGNSNTVELAAGQYYVKEKKAPKGYLTDNTVYNARVDAGETREINAADIPINDPVAIMLKKNDTENSKAVAGAEFTVKYYDKESEEELKDDNCRNIWVFRTDERGIITPDEEHKVRGDGFYLGSTGAPVFPVGYLTIQETKAPEGYLIDDKVYVVKIGYDAGGIVVDNIPENGYTVGEQPKRGDLDLIKTSERTGKALGGIRFSITSVETGESHIIVTDKNGFASTAASVTPHTNDTNAGKNSKSGVWFGAESAIDNGRGALPYGEYVIDELQSAANFGMDLIKGIRVNISEDAVTLHLGNINNMSIEIQTRAYFNSTGEQTAPVSENETFTDVVEYKNLTPERTTYRLSAAIVDPATDEIIAVSEKAFVPKKASGSVNVTFNNIDTSLFAGKTLVITEKLYDGDSLRAEHSDLNDEKQTLYIPEIHTKAADQTANDKSVRSYGEITLIDTVEYKGLIPGESYVLKGQLMDKETGEAIFADGVEILSETEFVPEKSEGSTEVSFTFDASRFAGKTVVAFETLIYKEKELAVHADINDEAQTVYFPKIHTSAKDKDTGGHTGSIRQNAVIIDTVTYSNLIPGKEYGISGILMDKDTKKPLLTDGKEVRAETVFVPENPEGEVELKYELDSTKLYGKRIVVFEDLICNDISVCTHNDIDDEAQSISYPEKEKTAERLKNTVRTSDNSGLNFAGAVLIIGSVITTIVLVTVFRRKNIHE